MSGKSSLGTLTASQYERAKTKAIEIADAGHWVDVSLLTSTELTYLTGFHPDKVLIDHAFGGCTIRYRLTKQYRKMRRQMEVTGVIDPKGLKHKYAQARGEIDSLPNDLQVPAALVILLARTGCNFSVGIDVVKLPPRVTALLIGEDVLKKGGNGSYNVTPSWRHYRSDKVAEALLQGIIESPEAKSELLELEDEWAADKKKRRAEYVKSTWTEPRRPRQPEPKPKVKLRLEDDEGIRILTLLGSVTHHLSFRVNPTKLPQAVREEVIRTAQSREIILEKQQTRQVSHFVKAEYREQLREIWAASSEGPG